MGSEELAGKRCKGQIKMPVKKGNAKIKPGLAGLSLGLNAPGISSSIASHHNRGSCLGCGGDLEGENGTFWGPGWEGEAKPRLSTKREGWESREPTHGCGPCPGAGSAAYSRQPAPSGSSGQILLPLDEAHGMGGKITAKIFGGKRRRNRNYISKLLLAQRC